MLRSLRRHCPDQVRRVARKRALSQRLGTPANAEIQYIAEERGARAFRVRQDSAWMGSRFEPGPLSPHAAGVGRDGPGVSYRLNLPIIGSSHDRPAVLATSLLLGQRGEVRIVGPVEALHDRRRMTAPRLGDPDVDPSQDDEGEPRSRRLLMISPGRLRPSVRMSVHDCDRPSRNGTAPRRGSPGSGVGPPHDRIVTERIPEEKGGDLLLLRRRFREVPHRSELRHEFEVPSHPLVIDVRGRSSLRVELVGFQSNRDLGDHEYDRDQKRPRLEVFDHLSDRYAQRGSLTCRLGAGFLAVLLQTGLDRSRGYIEHYGMVTDPGIRILSMTKRPSTLRW